MQTFFHVIRQEIWRSEHPTHFLFKHLLTRHDASHCLQSSNFERTQKGMEQQFSDLHALLQVYDPTFCSYLDRNESSQMSFTFR